MGNIRYKKIKLLGIILGFCLALFTICINQYQKEMKNVYAMNQSQNSKRQLPQFFENELTKINKIPDKAKRNQEKKRLRLEKQETLTKIGNDSQATVVGDKTTVQSKASISFVYADEDIKEEV
ncbi:hypothetical protein [Holzapfeliella sp. JNUCC 72]